MSSVIITLTDTQQQFLWWVDTRRVIKAGDRYFCAQIAEDGFYLDIDKKKLNSLRSMYQIGWRTRNLTLEQIQKNKIIRDVIFQNQYLIEDVEYLNALRQTYMGQFLKSRKL